MLKKGLFKKGAFCRREEVFQRFLGGARGANGRAKRGDYVVVEDSGTEEATEEGAVGWRRRAEKEKDGQKTRGQGNREKGMQEQYHMQTHDFEVAQSNNNKRKEESLYKSFWRNIRRLFRRLGMIEEGPSRREQAAFQSSAARMRQFAYLHNWPGVRNFLLQKDQAGRLRRSSQLLELVQRIYGAHEKPRRILPQELFYLLSPIERECKHRRFIYRRILICLH